MGRPWSGKGGLPVVAGALSATLEGWAVPAQATPWWDHNRNVAGSSGMRWRCGGADTGGSCIGAGTGNSIIEIIADCLSQPNSEAGIKYLTTGVCHQMANRILHPAGQITVVGCSGYGFSTARFGPYGRGNWPEKAKCYHLVTVTAVSSGAPNVQGDSMTFRKNAYNRAISRCRETSNNEDEIRRCDLAALVEFGLGFPLDHETFDSLATIQKAEVWKAHDELNAQLKLAVKSKRFLYAFQHTITLVHGTLSITPWRRTL